MLPLRIQNATPKCYNRPARRFSAMFTTLLLLLLQIAAPGQQAPATNPADLCTIQGVVISADSGDPIHKADIDASPAENRRQISQAMGGGAATDAMGRFEIKDLAPGKYYLSAQRNGFVQQTYGQTTPESSGKAVTLTPGQKLTDITFKLVPASVISGHVTDEDGEPVVYAEVTAMHFAYVNGQRRLVASRGGATNDLGEFRIFGLSPGQYFVRAVLRANRSDAARTREGYVPIYYPGVADAARASPVSLRGGDEVDGVDISLQPVRTLNVRGTLVGCPSADQKNQVSSVFLSDTSSVSSAPINSIARDVNGQRVFEIPGVPPGSYTLSAIVMRDGGRCTGHQSVEVTDNDIDGLLVNVSEGVDIRGQVRIEGQMSPSVSAIQIALEPRTNNGMFQNGVNDSAKPDGTFLLKGVHDGDYEVSVGNIPDTYYLKSARLDGVDALTAGVTIDTNKTPELLDILVSPNGAEVDGLVSKDQQPFQSSTVTLVPNPPYRGQRRLFRSISSDQDGRFTFQGLPPGDYKVFAWEKIERGAYLSSDFLQPYEDLGTAVHVTEGSHNSVQVDVIPSKDASQ